MSRRSGQRGQRELFAFALWAVGLQRAPTVAEIATFLDVSTRSAKRIHRNWMQAAPSTPTGGKRSPAPTTTSTP